MIVLVELLGAAILGTAFALGFYKIMMHLLPPLPPSPQPKDHKDEIN